MALAVVGKKNRVEPFYVIVHLVLWIAAIAGIVAVFTAPSTSPFRGFGTQALSGLPLGHVLTDAEIQSRLMLDFTIAAVVAFAIALLSWAVQEGRKV